MKFFSSSIIFSVVFFISQGLAVPLAEAQPVPDPGPGPVPEPGNDLAERDPFLKGLFPPKNCPTQQVNSCSTGEPYCCSTDSGKHNCVKSTVNCQQKVICCNNNFGGPPSKVNFYLPLIARVVTLGNRRTKPQGAVEPKAGGEVGTNRPVAITPGKNVSFPNHRRMPNRFSIAALKMKCKTKLSAPRFWKASGSSRSFSSPLPRFWIS
ncbi:predicted protein [Uncinocarpus reesii 1704]|uniref:Hydrophobin n=1 Tax=Uncinocarpus reesii (strain UAMH 1704) TaxID=336963 RepID=C4JVH0_UNCRE|nr:uncharacterized protein UREG_06562 [Uncinocarpus reesii 1704]EEP81697.1 predicted protein [Uncinocarpus reesii 1704]